MSIIPSQDMRQKLAYMNHRNPDGTLRPRDHPLRAPLVVDLENKAEVARVFNSGGAGIFAKPQDYCSKSRVAPISKNHLLTCLRRGPRCAVK